MPDGHRTAGRRCLLGARLGPSCAICGGLPRLGDIDPLTETLPRLEVEHGHDGMRYLALDVHRQLDDLQLRRAPGTADLEERGTPRVGVARRDDIGLAAD